MNTEELRAKVADVLRTRAEGWFIGAFDYDPIIEAVPSLLDEIDRLLEAYRTVCDYAETADALVAEVAALRAERDAARVQCQRLIELHDRDMARVSESLNAVTALCDEVERQTRPPYGFNLRHTDVRAALSSVPDVPAEHRRTDPACVFHEPPDPGSRLDEESRGLSCPVCMPEVTR